MAGWSDIFAQLAVATTAFLGALDPPIVPSYSVKGADVNSDGAPPRIVWFPVRHRYAPPAGRPTDLATRIPRFDCYIFGTDRDAVVVMENAVINAIYEACSPGCVSLVEAEWQDTQALDVEGDCLTLRFELMTPIYRMERATTLTPVDEIPITPELLSPLG